jgi:hypothetical protein
MKIGKAKNDTIEKYLDQLDRVVTLTAGEHQHLDKILRTAEQQRENCQLSSVLIGSTELTQRERQAIVKFKEYQTDAALVTGDFALGNILVANGCITRQQLEKTLHQRIETGRYLGEELIKAGHASSGQVERGLLLQRNLVACALAATVGLAPVVAMPVAAAQMSAAMPVSVTVVAHAKMQTNFQASQLKVSQNDVARGYVEVPAATRFSVESNSQSGYLMEFYPVSDVFDSVEIGGLGSTIQMGADGGVIVQRGSFPANQLHELSFRFVLRPDIMPGNYPWPLQLSVHAL